MPLAFAPHLEPVPLSGASIPKPKQPLRIEAASLTSAELQAEPQSLSLNIEELRKTIQQTQRLHSKGSRRSISVNISSPLGLSDVSRKTPPRTSNKSELRPESPPSEERDIKEDPKILSLSSEQRPASAGPRIPTISLRGQDVPRNRSNSHSVPVMQIGRGTLWELGYDGRKVALKCLDTNRYVRANGEGSCYADIKLAGVHQKDAFFLLRVLDSKVLFKSELFGKYLFKKEPLIISGEYLVAQRKKVFYSLFLVDAATHEVQLACDGSRNRFKILHMREVADEYTDELSSPRTPRQTDQSP